MIASGAATAARTLHRPGRARTIGVPDSRWPAIRLRSLFAPVLVVLLLGTLVGACTDPASDVITLDDQEQDTAPSEVAPPDAGARDAPSPATPGADQPVDCGSDLRPTLVATLDGQLAAITDGEWERALSFATDDFRDGIDADAFREVITDGFPVVAAAVARDVGRCAVDGTDATMLVTVEDADGAQQELLYLFQRDPDGWGIGGAVPATGATPSDEDTVTA